VSARATATSPAAPRGKTRVRLSGRAAILLFAVFVVAVLAIAPARLYLDQRSRLQGLEEQAAELEAANRQLEIRIADLQDPRTLERLARECLGMVEPGEIAIITVPRRGAPAPPSC
jgi:cell division protein FtsB